jgi:serine/threonine-protein kinase
MPWAQRLDAAAASLREIDDRLSEQTQRLGPDHLDIAATLAQKGRLLSSVGRYADARQILERALAIQRKWLLNLDARVAETRRDLVNVLREAGEPQLAIRVLSEVIDPYERPGQGRTGHERSVVGGHTLVDLGWAHLDAGYGYTARRSADRAWTILQPLLAENDAALARVLNLRGAAASNFRDFDGAIRLHERALAIASSKEAAHGDWGWAFSGLGRALTGQGRHAQADECHTSALIIARHVSGAQSQAVLRSLIMLANASLAAGDFGTSKRRGEEALAIIDAPEAMDSASTIRGLRVLGQLGIALNDRATARKMFMRALELREREYGSDNGLVADIWVELASTMDTPEELSEALILHRRALAFHRSRFPDTAKIGVHLTTLARSSRARGSSSKLERASSRH